MVRGGGVCWWASGRKQYITMEVISRKGIQYIQLYTAISREEFFQYMFILYYCICRYILLGPPGCAQTSPYLSPGLLDFFGGIKIANKPHASRNYTRDH